MAPLDDERVIRPCKVAPTVVLTGVWWNEAAKPKVSDMRNVRKDIYMTDREICGVSY